MLSIVRGNTVLLGVCLNDPDNNNAGVTSLSLATGAKFLVKAKKNESNSFAIIEKTLGSNYGIMLDAKKYTLHPEVLPGIIIETFSSRSYTEKVLQISYTYATTSITLGDGTPVVMESGVRFKAVDELGNYVIGIVTPSRLGTENKVITIAVTNTIGHVVVRLDPEDTKTQLAKQYYFGLQIEWSNDTQEIDLGTDILEIKQDVIDDGDGIGTILIAGTTGTLSPTWTVNANSANKKLTLDTTTQTQNIVLHGEKIVTTDGIQTITNKVIDFSLNTITNIPASAIAGGLVTLTTDQVITGAKTFTRPTGSSPFIVTTAYSPGSTVANLSADRLQGKLPPSGDIVGTIDTQTLTHKTLVMPVIADFTNAVHDHSSIAQGGFVSYNSLLNKPIISGSNTGDQVISDESITTSDITTNNVSTTKHGFFPKLPTPTGKFLKDDMTWVDVPISTNPADVLGPVSSVDNHVVLFNGVTGKLIKDSGLLLSGSNTGDETATTIKTKLGISTLSGSNTGDQDLSGLVPKTTTVNTHPLSSNISLTTSDISDSVNKRYVTDANLTVLANTSGSNTGDETGLTIKTKLGITTLSGSNTGDETASSIKSKLAVTTLSGSNTGDQDLSGLVPTTRTINGNPLNHNIVLNTEEIADSLDKRYVTDANLVTLSHTSGINTGDESSSTIKTKLGITSISGVNTGDQDLSGLVPKTAVDIDGTLTANSDAKIPSQKAVKTYVDLHSTISPVTSVNTKIGDVVLNKTDIGLSNVPNVDATNPVNIVTDPTHRFVTDSQIVVITHTSGVNTGDETTSTIKTKLGITTLSGANTGDETLTSIRSKLGITTLSGVNTGDQTLEGLGGVAANSLITPGTNTKITYDAKGLVTSGTTATTADIASSSNKRYVTDAQLTTINNTSGINTGDETASTIKTKLGVTVLSGNNTGDQTLGSLGAEAVVNKSISISTDATSDTKYPSVKAVKDYTDSLVVGLLDYRGAFIPAGAYPTSGGSGTAGAILKGDMWIMSQPGTVPEGVIQSGDAIIANIDAPGNDMANWDWLNANVTYSPEDRANKVTALSALSTDSQYPSAKLVFDLFGLTAALTGTTNQTFTVNQDQPNGQVIIEGGMAGNGDNLIISNRGVVGEVEVKGIDLINAAAKYHDQNTDIGTINDTLTIDMDDNAATYVKLKFKNGVNDRTIRVNKSTNDFEFQKKDGIFISLQTIIDIAGIRKYAYAVPVDALTWYINHNLGTNDITVSIWDTSNNLIHGEITQISANQLNISFVTPQSGRAVITG